MDKVKVIFTKHGFWIGCGCIALLVIGVWYWTIGQIAEETNANKGKINTNAANIKQVQNKKPHPNKFTEKEMDRIVQEFGWNVHQGWDMVYAKQKEILVWPDSFDVAFRRAVDKLRPIEAVPTDKEALLVQYREVYRDFIVRELPSLAKIIGAEWKARAANELAQPMVELGPRIEQGPVGPDGRPIVVDNSIVRWNAANQQELLDSLFGFTSRVDARPSTLEVLYAQESMWVLQSLMKTIKRVNQNATARHEASVRDIDYVRVGQAAGSVSGKVTVPQPPVAPTGPGAPMEPRGGGGVGPGGPMSPTMTPGAPASPVVGGKVSPAEGRYVDQNYVVLPVARLLAAATTPDDVVLAVAKRMPVRMRLLIDQRKLPKLLAECGNAELPLEVRQVRINRESTAANAVGAFNAGGPGERGPGPGPGILMPQIPQMPNMLENPAGGVRGGPQNKDSSVDTNEVWVEVFGIVYIYNPVNDVLLGVQAVAGAAPAAPAGPAGPGPAGPAAAPPAGPAGPVPAPVPGPAAAVPGPINKAVAEVPAPK